MRRFPDGFHGVVAESRASCDTYGHSAGRAPRPYHRIPMGGGGGWGVQTPELLLVKYPLARCAD